VKNPIAPGLKSKKILFVFGLAAATLTFLGGASYAPVFWQTPRVPQLLMEAPVQGTPAFQTLPRPAVKMKTPKSKLAERLNSRYRLGRSLHSAA